MLDDLCQEIIKDISKDIIEGAGLGEKQYLFQDEQEYLFQDSVVYDFN